MTILVKTEIYWPISVIILIWLVQAIRHCELQISPATKVMFDVTLEDNARFTPIDYELPYFAK